MTAELYEQITHATSRANATLELVAHLALSSGKGLNFADAVRSVASQLEDAQEALDDYLVEKNVLNTGD